jgi:hypothetical protein
MLKSFILCNLKIAAYRGEVPPLFQSKPESHKVDSGEIPTFLRASSVLLKKALQQGACWSDSIFDFPLLLLSILRVLAYVSQSQLNSIKRDFQVRF